MAQLPTAVIGLGFMGSRWARAFAEHDGARLAVVSDLREDLGKDMADRYGAQFVHDPVEAAAYPNVAAVAVCTPEHTHVDAAVAAIAAGHPVMVEKPLAHTVTAAESVRDQAARQGVPVLVGHVLRFEPRYAAIHSAVESGEIGAVQAVRSERIGLISDQRILQGRTSIPLYYGVHELDLCRWYAGDVTTVWATSSTGVVEAAGYPVADLYSVGLRFASGAHGTSMLGWSLPETTPGYGVAGFTVIGERGVAQVSQGDVGLRVASLGGTRHPDVCYAPEVDGRLFGALAIEVDHFVRVAAGATEPRCTGADGVEAVRLALAVERAAQQGEVVRP